MEWTDFERKTINVVMEMAYQEGIEEGKKQVLDAIKSSTHAKDDYSHRPQKNIYAKENNDKTD